jgi:hypothetical protein
VSAAGISRFGDRVGRGLNSCGTDRDTSVVFDGDFYGCAEGACRMAAGASSASGPRRLVSRLLV